MDTTVFKFPNEILFLQIWASSELHRSPERQSYSINIHSIYQHCNIYQKKVLLRTAKVDCHFTVPSSNNVVLDLFFGPDAYNL